MPDFYHREYDENDFEIDPVQNAFSKSHPGGVSGSTCA